MEGPLKDKARCPAAAPIARQDVSVRDSPLAHPYVPNAVSTSSNKQTSLLPAVTRLMKGKLPEIDRTCLC